MKLIDEAKAIIFPIDKIDYLITKGDFYQETKVTGGGGGGSSITGAIVGGMIAGETGAIIGSRKKVQEVKSETISHDTRKTVLSTAKEDKHVEIEFGFTDFATLKYLIPEKDLSSLSNASTAVRSEDKASAVKLRELSNLKEEGIITVEEINQKKDTIVQSIPAVIVIWYGHISSKRCNTPKSFPLPYVKSSFLSPVSLSKIAKNCTRDYHSDPYIPPC